MPKSAEMNVDMLSSLITANAMRNIANMKTEDGPITDDVISGNLLDAFLAGTMS